MSVSKSIRKKRRQSKKRNMRGGGLPDSCALLSYNTSFVLSMAELFRYTASECTSIYIRLMKLKAEMGNTTDTPEVFMTKYYGALFIMSCKIIDAFFLKYRADYEYCVAALQEMNPTNHYLTTMKQNIASEELTILASAVSINNGTGLAYVIPSDTLDKFKDKLEYVIPSDIQKLQTPTGIQKVDEANKKTYDTWFKSRDNKEWFSNVPLYDNFNAQKVAIVDLGDHQKYANEAFIKANPDGSLIGPDNGRPMSLIVREESDDCYTLHFNCHIPNPSALKVSPSYTESILEKFSAGDSRYMTTWATITYEIINEEAAGLLLRFFTPEQLTTLTPNNCRIIFSGDFNDGNGMLMNLMKTAGLTVAGSSLVDIGILFSDFMPKSCCSNFNSVTNFGIKNTPPALKLVDIETQKNSPKTDPLLAALLKDPDPTLSQYDYIVNTDNYAFVGDGTGSNISLVSEIFDPDIVSGIPIDYRTLTSKYIRASDHMPVISYTSSATRSSFESRRLLDGTEGIRQDKEPANKPSVERERGDLGAPELLGGYRKKHKKRKSQRKLSRRKYKRHTKKRKY
jgi:hypothetical protein